jgi:hypothetical protein
MTEVDVTLSDYGLALECAVLAWLTQREPAGYRAVREWLVLFFASVGLAALLAGTAQGFFLDPRTGGARLLGPAILLAVGLMAVAAWGLGAAVALSPLAARWFLIAAVLDFLGYSVIVVGIQSSFGIAVLNYLPAAAFLLIVLWRRSHVDPRVQPAAVGVLLTVVAFGIQRAHIALHPLYFDGSALSHAVQALALFLVFRGARWLVREAAVLPAAAARSG